MSSCMNTVSILSGDKRAYQTFKETGPGALLTLVGLGRSIFILFGLAVVDWI